MMTTPLYTWRDVERLLSKAEQAPWAAAIADGETLVVHCAPEKTEACSARLQQLLGLRFRQQDASATVDLIAAPGQQRRLEVIFDHDAPPERNRRVVRPLWSEANRPIIAPPMPEGSPPVVAFYSFKGGVGRTTVLLATLGALLEQHSPARVLVVDADLEAPGLTLQLTGAPDRFTLLDFFALIHDSADWTTTALPIALDRLGPTISLELGAGKREFFFLPAFRLEDVPTDPTVPVANDALFAPDLLPEHLVRAPGRAFIVGDSLAALGKMLDVDVVLVDLRAGVSEVSSPLMLDPRVHHVLVSACGFQSFEGTRHMLRRLRRAHGNETRSEVVLTMIPPGYDPEALTDQVATLKNELAQENNDDVAMDLATPNVHQVPFAQELLDFASIEELLRDKVPGTQLGKKAARDIAAAFAPEKAVVSPSAKGTPAPSLDDVAALAKKLEYAEQNTELGLLATPMVTALVDDAKDALPAAVVLGAKGAGKTYVWGQMVLAERFGDFAKQVHERASKVDAWVFPLLSSRNLEPPMRDKIRDAEDTVRRHLGGKRPTPMSEIELRHALAQDDVHGNDLEFWCAHIAARLGIQATDLPSILTALEKKKVSVCLVVDGLEDAFQTVPGEPMKEAHRRKLRSLLSDLTPMIRDARSHRLGIVTFVRRDLAQAAIPQNFGQFEKQHERYALTWEPIDALRLVAWILARASFLKLDELDKAPYDELREALTAFWDKRMGSQESREPNTDDWVIAALSDYQNRLQARDLVRLVGSAAAESARESTTGKLTPTSLRNALGECSRKKVDELKQETPGLKDVLDKLDRGKSEDKRVPFKADSFSLTRDEVEFLATHGVIARGKGDDLYFPEIIRHGLGFKLRPGRRPAVLKMYRQSQGRRR